MAAVQTIMDSREKAGPSERPNMQSANVFKGFTNRASGVQMSIEHGVRGLVGLMSECVSQATPPPKKCICVLPWQLLAELLAEADVIVNLLLMRREANGVMERKQERRRHFCPTGNKTSCAHTAAGQTLMNSFTHSFAYTLSHKTPACFPFVSPNQHPSFFLYLPSHLCSAIYFCLYFVSSSIIIGTIGD